MIVKQFDIEQASKQYQEAQPFPHIVLNDLVDYDLLTNVMNEFPVIREHKHVAYANPLEIKDITSGRSMMGGNTQKLIDYLNSQEWLDILQKLTGIPEPLIADPLLMGGGLHSSTTGGLLKLHIDFNKHYATGYDRRVNLLLYLNKDWDEDWGGNIELWEHGFDEKGDITAEQRWVSESPTFNKMVIFNTTETSLHGFPDPLQCPSDRKRMSLAMYYYSNGRSDIKEGKKHNSVWAARPNNENDNQVNKLKK